MTIREKIGLVLALYIVTCGHAVAQSSSILTGQLQDWEGSDTLILSYRIAPGRDTAIRIPITDGVFHYEDTSTMPVRAKLRDREDRRLPHEVDEALIYLTPGKTTHVTGRRTLGSARVRGTALQRQYRKLLRRMHCSSRRRMALQQQLEALEEAGCASKSQRYRALKARSAARQERLDKRLADFVENHPQSIVSLDVLQGYTLDVATAKVGMKLYNALDASVQATPFGKEIGQQLGTANDLAQPTAPLPDFTSTTPEGEPLTLGEVLDGNRLLLLTFWASWSVYSERENNALRETYEAFHRIGFEILGVSLDKHRDRWREAIADHQLQWPQVSSMKGWAEPIAQLYGITSIPTHILLNGKREVVAAGLRGDELYAFVRDFLAREPVAEY